MADAQDTASPKPAVGPVRRTLQNAGWLLAGKGVGGVFSLIYVGVVARSLGIEQFGVFALILAYVQAISALAKFDSWKTVVRYGAEHLDKLDKTPLRRILNFSTFLDLGSATVGAAVGILGVFVVGPHLGWSDTEQTIAGYACILLLFNIRGTPLGILRLLDRFDIAAYAEAALPSIRLIGALLAWFIHPSIFTYLLVWVLAELLAAAVLWWAALRELHVRHPALRATPLWQVSGVRTENDGLWFFAWTTNIDYSLKQVWKHIPVLVVGWLVDAVAAGGFQLANKLVNGLRKPSTALAWAVFPELTRLKVSEPGKIRPVVRKTTQASALAGTIGLLLTVVLGHYALWALGGEDFTFAYPILLMLAVAAMINLCGLTIESAIVALGYPGQMLWVRAVVGVGYAALLLSLVPLFGIYGAGWAAIAAAMLLLALVTAKFRGVAASVV